MKKEKAALRYGMYVLITAGNNRIGAVSLIEGKKN